MAARSTSDWLVQLAAHGVPSAPVNDVEAAFVDPQTVARDLVVEYEHPTLGVVRGPATPFRLDRDRPAAVRGPTLGEHTHDVLRALCGYSEPELERLTAAGVFGSISEKEEL